MKKQVSDIKEHILEKASELLRQSGLKCMGQIQVAKSANISQGNLTYHFPKRSDLILAVSERAVRPIKKMVHALALEKGPLNQAALHKILKMILCDTERTRALLGLLVESDDNPELLKKLNSYAEREKTLVAAVLGRKENDPAVLAAQAALIGLAVQHYLIRDSSKNDEWDEALKFLSNALKNPKKKKV